jgi:predicted nucleic acid-binding protein
MTLADLKRGDAVFVDANIFVYHFAPDPVLGGACTQFLDQIERQELVGYTSTSILCEVAHRLATLEARTQFGWSAGKVIQRLKQNPGHFPCLSVFRAAVEAICKSKVQVLTATPPLIVTAVGTSQQAGLLIIDAVTVALMQMNGLTKLASSDTDFDRVPGLSRYSPN